MLGTYQNSHLRLEVSNPAAQIRDSLITVHQINQWIWPQQLEPSLPPSLSLGLRYKSQLGGLTLDHEVLALGDQELNLRLENGVNGFHHWRWGDGWIQSQLEGVTLMPLNLAHTYALWRLRSFLGGLTP